MPNPHFDLEHLSRDLLLQLAPQPGHDLPRTQWDEDERSDRRPKTATIQALLIQPNAVPELVTIANDLDAMRGIIGGTLTTFDTGIEGTIGVAHDEPILQQMPPNRFVPATGALFVGPLFVAGGRPAKPGQCLNFHSLSKLELTQALTVFGPPRTAAQVQKALRAHDETLDWIESELSAGLDD